MGDSCCAELSRGTSTLTSWWTAVNLREATAGDFFAVAAATSHCSNSGLAVHSLILARSTIEQGACSLIQSNALRLGRVDMKKCLKAVQIHSPSDDLDIQSNLTEAQKRYKSHQREVTTGPKHIMCCKRGECTLHTQSILLVMGVPCKPSHVRSVRKSL